MGELFRTEEPHVRRRRLIGMRRIASVVLVGALVAGGCGSETAGSTTAANQTTTAGASTSGAGTSIPESPTTPPSAPTLIGSGTVLDKAGVGPQLCSGVLDSLPPQCQGLPVVGLDWGDIPWADTAGDTTWADAQLVGTFNGRELILTESPMEPSPAPFDPPDFATPCPTPDGGWTAPDPASAGERDFQRANEYALEQAEFAGSWVDHRQEPAEGTPFAEAYIANFSFTSDLDRHRTEIEQLYGGPMCVSEGKRPLAELRDIQKRVFDAIFSPQAEAAGIYASYGASGGADQFEGVVEVSVMIALGGTGQAWLDDEFGPDTVVLHSFLQPYEGG